MWQSVSLLTRRNDIVQTCYGIRNSLVMQLAHIQRHFLAGGIQ